MVMVYKFYYCCYLYFMWEEKVRIDLILFLSSEKKKRKEGRKEGRKKERNKTTILIHSIYNYIDTYP